LRGKEPLNWAHNALKLRAIRQWCGTTRLRVKCGSAISAADNDYGRVVGSLLSKGSMPDFDESIIAINAPSILPPIGLLLPSPLPPRSE